MQTAWGKGDADERGEHHERHHARLEQLDEVARRRLAYQGGTTGIGGLIDKGHVGFRVGGAGANRPPVTDRGTKGAPVNDIA
jgi:hypothetical protein